MKPRLVHRAPPRDDDVAQRRRDLAAIHLLASSLGMDTADKSPASVYRAMLLHHGGSASAADLDLAGRRRVLRHLRQAAGHAQSKPRDGWQAEKIRTLWAQLHDLGVVLDPGEAALASFVHRLTRVHGVRMLTAQQGNSVIEALKAWIKRSTARGGDGLPPQGAAK